MSESPFWAAWSEPFRSVVAPGPGDETRRRIARRSIEDQEMLLRRAEMGMDVPWDDFDLPASA